MIIKIKERFSDGTLSLCYGGGEPCRDLSGRTRLGSGLRDAINVIDDSLTAPEADGCDCADDSSTIAVIDTDAATITLYVRNIADAGNEYLGIPREI